MIKPAPTNIEFVVTITEHRVLGYMLFAYLIAPNEQGTFYTILNTVLKEDIEKHNYEFSKDQKTIVHLIDSISDENLAKRFSKQYGSKEFFEKIGDDYFKDHVVPFIDRQILKCIDLIRANQIKLYYKPAKYANIYDEDLIAICPEPPKAVFQFENNEEWLRYNLKIFCKEREIKITHKNVITLTDSPCTMIIQNELYQFKSMGSGRLKPFLKKDIIQIPASIKEKYFKSFVLNTIRNYQVESKGFEIRGGDSNKRSIISIERDLNQQIILVLYFNYGKAKFKANQKGSAQVELTKENQQFVFYKYERDHTWEKKVLKQLENYHVTINQSIIDLKIPYETAEQSYTMINWLNAYSEELRNAGIYVEQEAKSQLYFLGEQEIKFDIKTKDDWFDVYAEVSFGTFKIPFIKLRKYILNGIREYALPDGKIAILPQEWFTEYGDLFPFAEKKGNAMRFSKHHYQLLKQSLQSIDKSIVKKIYQIDTSNFDDIKIPVGLKANLRAYQKEGYAWMHFLAKNNFGGCLADDMGLGKTLQTLTLLLKAKNDSKQAKKSNEDDLHPMLLNDNEHEVKASLIVVPTSLVHNWENEVKKFTPTLKSYKHIGFQRKKINNIKSIANYYDIIVTTYGTIRNDYEQMNDIVFNYIILDESQYIKNPHSKSYKAVNQLRSNHRLALTGTPIENSLSDLWAQINFINKGLLGSFNYFKREFIHPIEKHQNEEKQQTLKHLVSPFILRRNKEDVAKDLPPISEQIRLCKMTDAQHKLYDREKSAIRNSILESLENKDEERSTFVILQGLTKLRQIANHPALVEEKSSKDSGKFNDIMRGLGNIVNENHKVLVFSSFVKHLELFEKEFDQLGWKYCKLIGQTTNREEVVKNFQTNPKIPIFLISLKAGGVGLNLTSADYIFILDPWWNPATEKQAINRAHRIGQNKNVFVYRFITEGSIEEKIQLLKERKAKLAEQFITSENPFNSLSQDEILHLFE